jgi:hypothetical protein
MPKHKTPQNSANLPALQGGRARLSVELPLSPFSKGLFCPKPHAMDSARA